MTRRASNSTSSTPPNRSTPAEELCPPAQIDLSLFSLQSIAEASGDGIWLIDRQCRTRYINDRGAAMLGWSPEEMIGSPVTGFAEDRDRKALVSRFGGQPQADRLELRLRRKTNAPFWVMLSTTPLFDRNGRHCCTLAIMADVSEQKSREARLLASERRYRLLTENSLDCVVLLAHDGNILFASPSVTALLGYTEAEFVGSNALAVIHPEDSPAIQEAFGALLQEAGGRLRTEFRCRRKDGSWRWIEAAATNLLGEASFEAVVASFRDITERKHAEESLGYIIGRSRCLPWQAIVREHTTAEGIQWYEWKTLDFDDDAAQRFIPLERRPGESYATAWYRCKDPDEQRRIDNNSARALRARESSYTQDFRCRGADGKIYWVHEQVNMEPVGEGEWRLAGLCFDITERRILEEQLRRHAAELDAANQSKDEFLAMLAHELRNPLAAMGTAIHLLASEPGDSPVETRARAVIERQVRHMTRQVNDLLDVSRLDRGKIEIEKKRLDLRAVVRECVEDYRSPLDEVGVKLSLELPSHPVWVQGDHTRLSQVIANLLDNAAKFTRHSDSVDIALASPPQSNQAVISVRDTGAGIEPNLLPDIFEAFTQAQQNLERGRGGLGMGLAMVKGLVELHGGSVKAFSEGQGHGSTFTIVLPLAAEAAPDEQPVQLPSAGQQPPSPAANRGKRVLIVEDNRDAAEMLRDILLLFGHQVETAYDGREGVAMARKHPPDIVLCDLGLPGMDGWEVARMLRHDPATCTVRLMAVTGYGRAEDVARSREAGFDEHLTKPVDPLRLRQLLET